MQPETKLQMSEILQVVRQTKLEMLAVRRVLERCEERADSALQYLRALESTLAAESQATMPGLGLVFAPLGTGTISGKYNSGESWSVLENLATVGVERLKILWLPDESALVQVNDAKAFKLSQTLGRLLEILAHDDTHADGALVGWKSYDEVAVDLGKKVGRHFEKHAINQLVFRLRRALVIRAKLNPLFVQSHRRFGLRFAVRRKEQV
jgi:hypothetical protein